jgi:hypothetical protein
MIMIAASRKIRRELPENRAIISTSGRIFRRVEEELF